jgi:hypothetical protein
MNAQYYPVATFINITTDTTRIVAGMPPRGDGCIVRGVSSWLSVEQAPHPSNYWVVELGTVVGQMEFRPRTQISTPFKGMAKGENAVVFAREVAYDPGETIAVRAYPVGLPAGLADFQVLVRIEEA